MCRGTSTSRLVGQVRADSLRAVLALPAPPLGLWVLVDDRDVTRSPVTHVREPAGRPQRR
jgi:hypothetical protein